MDFEEEFELEHVLFAQRTCKTCGKTKDLIDGFYRTRKDRGNVPSAYSYECKSCTIERVVHRRRDNPITPATFREVYPDW